MWIERVARWVQAHPERLFARLVNWIAGHVEENLPRTLVGSLAAMFVLMIVLITIIELIRYWLGLPPLGRPT